MLRPQRPSRLRDGAQLLSLRSPCIVATLLIVLLVMAALGLGLDRYFRAVEIDRAAQAQAPLANLLIAPLLAELPVGRLVPGAIADRLDRRLGAGNPDPVLGQVTLHWRDGGIAYRLDRQLPEARRDEPALNAAFRGEVSADLIPAAALPGARPGEILRSHVPLVAPGGTAVIAVAEIRQDGTALRGQMRQGTRRVWLAVGLATLLLVSLLGLLRFGAVHRLRDRDERLKASIDEARLLARQNDDRRRKAEAARLEAVMINEQALDRLGADLHAGPLQLLRKVAVRTQEQAAAADQPAETARFHLRTAEIVGNAAQELRQLAYGLSLPEIPGVPLCDMLRIAAQRHESQTGSAVSISIGALPDRLPDALKVSLYRAAQEALTAAFRHGGGRGQFLRAQMETGAIVVVVGDRGAGRAPGEEPGFTGLGLSGLRRRMQSLGGTLDIAPREGGGRVVTARLPICAEP